LIIEGKQVTERVKVEEASRITGVPVGTLRFWRATNQGPRSYAVGRRLWFDVGKPTMIFGPDEIDRLARFARGEGYLRRFTAEHSAMAPESPPTDE
jgi:hypothetical protein